MAVAIVHYHLRRGGVTRVIEAQSRALRALQIEHVILSGTSYEGKEDLPVVLLDDLDYRTHRKDVGVPTLHSRLRELATKSLGGEPDLWHVHNPTLGKNALFPGFLEECARNRERLVLQFHDFAEDGRPDNYELLAEQSSLYPLAPQILYTFINKRDRDLALGAGVPQAQTFLLPNAVAPAEVPASTPAASAPTVLYPVRGIRRKNLGELCLLAALAPVPTRFALTLAPENDTWRPIYDDWAAFVSHNDLPVLLGVVGTVEPAPGVPSTFENWIAHSSHLVTTSIAEGFGLAFLEPIGLRKPLLGRDLPEITGDFKEQGLRLGNLYEELLVPRPWVDLDRLQHELVTQLSKVYRAYRTPLDDSLLAVAQASLHRGDYLDFGNLPEALQLDVIARAQQDPLEVMISQGDSLRPAVEWLTEALAATTSVSSPAALAPYSEASYAEMLDSLYRKVQDPDPAQVTWLDKSLILKQFLAPQRFHFLRTS